VVATLRGGRAGGPFDVVLADPPYAGEEAGQFLPLAAEHLAPGGVLVLERDTRASPLEGAGAAAARFRSVRYGRCRFDWYRRSPGPGRG
jgi:16S rRNA G966 N2-methylase RsmD